MAEPLRGKADFMPFERGRDGLQILHFLDDKPIIKPRCFTGEKETWRKEERERGGGGGSVRLRISMRIELQ